MATVMTTGRHPPAVAIAARLGRKISAPVAVLVVRMPMTRPRFLTNQRLTTVAPRTMATQPEPRPENRPQVSTNCQGAVMKALAPVESAIRESAAISVRLMPKLCMRAAAKGPTRP
jgi:hypothetical protein